MQIGSTSAAALAQMQAKIFSKIDANSDGGITLEEMTSGAPTSKTGKTEDAASVAKRFASMDTDSNGSVTEEESVSYLQTQIASGTMGSMLQAQEASQSGPPPMGGAKGGSAPQTFDELDTNEDGTVSLDEMTAASGTDESGDTSKIEELFSAMDADGDGSVTESEKSSFDEQMRANGPPPGGPGGPQGAGGMGGGAQSFDALDTNQDGTVSLDEMMAASGTDESGDTSKIEELFSAMDSDGDGSVTETEKSSFDEQMRANGPPPPQGAPTQADSASDSTSGSDATAAKFAALTSRWMQSMASVIADQTTTTTTSVAA
ncbi:EF-hand domain-containing protein [Asticcacaulis sp. BYS171W]|uniref:EF-hand domain-containing protein n=1 Tax=Asticcacaulis aquaticus TaxID=2984212 RepID=A0ABT5HU61_9CAUL|nr:EF-hand domain-containing protein [Asticcacaulis aquaticus]MDC7683612.1 EF-hand domain-containing protein [Asticcacaulis aquaticus]